MPPVFQQRVARSGDRGLFVGFLILLVLAPLPWGGDPAWAKTLFSGALFVLGLFWTVQYVRGRVDPTPSFTAARWPLILLALWCVYVALQLVPMPLSWLERLSPTAAELYAYTGATRAPLSVDPGHTFLALLLSGFLTLSFALALLLVHSRRRVRVLIAVVVASGTFQAVYGSAMVLSGTEWGFLAHKVYYLGAATGTFFNKNHLAGYLEMALGLGLGLMLTQRSETRGHTARARLVGVLKWMTSWKIMLRLLLVTMVIGVVLSRSRMGNIAFFTGLVVFGVLGLLARRPMSRRPFLILVVSVVLIDALVIGKWFGFDRVVQRIEQTSLSRESRDDVGIQVMPAIEDYWLVGSGMGSFASVFPHYRGPDVKHFWDHAHNDYLEFLLEAGVLGSALLAAFLGLNLAQGMKRCWRAQTQLRWGIAMGAMMASVSLLVHTFVDFNLQIPANAMLFMVTLSLFWFESASDSAPRRTGPM